MVDLSDIAVVDTTVGTPERSTHVRSLITTQAAQT